MVLGKNSALSRNNRTGNIPRCRQNAEKTQEKEGNRESKNSTMAEQNFYSSKKGFSRRKIDTRPILPQHLYQMSSFQDAYHSRSEATPPQGMLDNLHRFQRWLLASTSGTGEKTVPGFPLEKSELAIQGNALRPKCCTPHLHQGSCTCSESSSRGRDLVFTIFRRSANSGLLSGGMLNGGREVSKNLEIPRMATEFKEIKAKSCSKIRVVGGSVRPYYSHSNGTQRKTKPSARTPEGSPYCRKLLNPRDHAVAGHGKLDWYARSNCKVDAFQNKENNQDLQTHGYRQASHSQQKHETQSLQVDCRSSGASEFGSTITRLHNPNRCLTSRLGLRHQQHQLLRKVRQVNDIQHQHSRVVNSLVFTSHDFKEKCSDTDPMRQLHINSSGSQSLISGTAYCNVDRAHLEKSSIASMDPLYSSHSGELQCDSRSAITGSRIDDRMVSINQGFSENTENEPLTSRRSVCHQSQQSASNFCVSLSGHEGSSSRCAVNTLGTVGTSVSLPTNKPGAKSTGQTGIITVQECSVSYNRDTYQTMVYGSEAPQGSLSPARSSTPTDSSEPTSNETKRFETSRLAVIKTAYERRFPDCNEATELMAKPLRENSSKDYQQKWERFVKFLQDEGTSVEDISISCALRFFTHLFSDKGLKPGTIAHYRSALTVPLKTYNIDLKTPEVSDMIRAMYIRRPNAPVSEPHWSLNKVLTFIDNLPEPLSNTRLLRKSAFLLLLATGWRISELHACVRHEEYCQFSYDSSLRLRPHPSFLAKNECPRRRWTHKEIKNLTLPDGKVSKLCPVSALRDYINRSDSGHKGPLFQPYRKEAKPFTVSQLSAHICKLILEADKETKANVHEVRKYASSCALAQTMLIGELTNAIGWSSPVTFYKHYLSATEPLKVNAVLPVMSSGTQH